MVLDFGPGDVPRPWTALYPPGVPASYEYPAVGLGRFLEDAARDFPATIACEFAGATTTYAALAAAVGAMAGGLRALGVGPGDRVGIALANTPQHVVALFAVWRLGAVVSEHAPGLRDERLAAELADAGCRAVLIGEAPARLAALRPGAPGVAHWLVTRPIEDLALPRRWKATARAAWLAGDAPARTRAAIGTWTARRRTPAGLGDGLGAVRRLREVVRAASPVVQAAAVEPARDPAVILYPPRPGAPLGVTLSHANLVANAFQSRLWVPDVQAGGETVLCAVPFSQVHGLTSGLAAGVLSAATLALTGRDGLARTVARSRPTLFPGLPALFAELAAGAAARRDLSSLRVCLSGAGPLPGDVVRRFEQRTGARLRDGYGLTETSPLVLANPVYGRAKPGTVGLPMPDTLVALLDLQHPWRLAAPGTPGELAVRGPQVMQGYWGRPQQTADVLRDGWLLTGDVARMDEEGYVTLLQRAPRPHSVT